jgi:hypothetical protein
MSGEPLLATPARPLYEPSHRPPKKKERPKSLSFCSDNTVTDDQHGASVHSGPPFFGFRAYSRCDRLPHAVRPQGFRRFVRRVNSRSHLGFPAKAPVLIKQATHAVTASRKKLRIHSSHEFVFSPYQTEFCDQHTITIDWVTGKPRIALFKASRQRQKQKSKSTGSTPVRGPSDEIFLWPPTSETGS